MPKRNRKADLRMFPDEEKTEVKSNNKKNNAFLQQNPAYDNTEEGATANVMLALPDWNRPCVKTDDELLLRWDDYFRECVKRDVRPTIEGLACSAGVDYQTLHDWETGKRKPTPFRSELVQKAKSYVRYVLSTMATKGQVNPVTFIFMAKNYFGMKDKVEYEVEQKNLLASNTTADEVRSRIVASVPLEEISSFSDFEVLDDITPPKYEKQSSKAKNKGK